MHYRLMTIDDYDAAVALWRNTEGVLLRDADSREGVARYFPGLSVVAEVEGEVVGTVVGGHDAHRGDSALGSCGIASQCGHRLTTSGALPGCA